MDAQHPLAVVTPTLDGDVLGVLALADEAFTTGQLHRTLARFSEDGIRKALARLRKQGIVVSEPAGKAYLYRFNRDHRRRTDTGPSQAPRDVARADRGVLGELEAASPLCCGVRINGPGHSWHH